MVETKLEYYSILFDQTLSIKRSKYMVGTKSISPRVVLKFYAHAQSKLTVTELLVRNDPALVPQQTSLLNQEILQANEFIASIKVMKLYRFYELLGGSGAGAFGGGGGGPIQYRNNELSVSVSRPT